MSKIIRDPEKAGSDRYDLIIIGGGIYGAMLALESSRRGLCPLLLERDDFGQHTSFNSLRIIHGGLRYLQSFDLHRFRESVSERRWFLKTFPDLVKPLPCLMPLYGDGLRRPAVLRFALRLNDLLSNKRNRGVRINRQLPASRIVDADKTMEIFPMLDRHGLKGSAIWYDAFMPDLNRLLIEALRWAGEFGATILNYVEARHLLRDKNSVAGVIGVDKESGRSFEFKSNVVVNAAGPWCRNLAAGFHRDMSSLFKPSIAWNVLLNKKAFADHALVASPKKLKSQTYFLVPWKGKILAGTGHLPLTKEPMERPMPTTDEIHEFLNRLNSAVPGLEARMNDILYLFSGLLPANDVGKANLKVREVIIDHNNHKGPKGLYSISGVKFTTSRLVAEKILNRIFPEKKINNVNNAVNTSRYHKRKSREVFDDFNLSSFQKDKKWMERLKVIVKEESVIHLDDLIFRRTKFGELPDKAIEAATLFCQVFEWDKNRCHQEIQRVKNACVQDRL